MIACQIPILPGVGRFRHRVDSAVIPDAFGGTACEGLPGEFDLVAAEDGRSDIAANIAPGRTIRPFREGTAVMIGISYPVGEAW